MGFTGSYRKYLNMTNIIINPTFDSHTSNWYAGGDLVLSASSTSPYSGAKCAKGVVVTAAISSIFQVNVPVVASKKYRLRFAAYCSTGHDMTVQLFKHVSPYTLYGLNQAVALNSSWTFYTIDFSTNSSASTDARLRFYFDSYASGGDIYYLDEINLGLLSEIQSEFMKVF